MAHEIGAFVFIKFSRYPGLVAEQVRLETQQGVDGTGVWFTGIRGVPFDLQTVAFFTTMSAGRTAAEQYRLLTDDPPVTVKYDGTAISNHLYQVQRVDVLNVEKVWGVVSGTVALCKVTARWQLVPIGT